jgi:predicted RNase H-like nuclease (RuvC/YqgF family)
MGSSIFGDSKDENSEAFTKIDTHSKAILIVTQRQKDLESKLDLVSEKIELLDHNSISNIKKINSDIKSLRTDMRDLTTNLEELKSFNSKVKKQLSLMTTKDEVKKLEKYIDLWNPMTFVTRQELKKNKEDTVEMIREIIGDFLNKPDNK